MKIRLRRASNKVLAVTALLCIALQFNGQLLFSVIALSLWLIIAFIVERDVISRLWKPRFWLISLVFALASGLLLGERDVQLFGVELSRAGLGAGLMMVVRGGLLFGIAVWASRVLTMPQFKTRLASLGPLANAVIVAIELLPRLQGRWNMATKDNGLNFWQRLQAGAALLVFETMRIAQELASSVHLVGVIGPPRSGKTTCMLSLADSLKRCGLIVKGVVQPYEDGHYLLLDLSSGEARPFAKRRSDGGGFLFEQDGWLWARTRIQDALLTADVAIVDEIGRLEEKGDGHMRAITLLNAKAKWLVLAVREDCFNAVETQLGHFDKVVASRNGQDVKTLEALILGGQEDGSQS